MARMAAPAPARTESSESAQQPSGDPAVQQATQAEQRDDAASDNGITSSTIVFGDAAALVVIAGTSDLGLMA